MTTLISVKEDSRTRDFLHQYHSSNTWMKTHECEVLDCKIYRQPAAFVSLYMFSFRRRMHVAHAWRSTSPHVSQCLFLQTLGKS